MQFSTIASIPPIASCILCTKSKNNLLTTHCWTSFRNRDHHVLLVKCTIRRKSRWSTVGSWSKRGKEATLHTFPSLIRAKISYWRNRLYCVLLRNESLVLLMISIILITLIKLMINTIDEEIISLINHCYEMNSDTLRHGLVLAARSLAVS